MQLVPVDMIQQTQRTFEMPIGIDIQAPYDEAYEQILSASALDFLLALHEHFDVKRELLLAKRAEQQHAYDKGKLPDFLPDTLSIREEDWQIAPIPNCIIDRKVEITGPVDRKMTINALNSGANVFMADLEDSTTPTWANIMNGQVNLKDAVFRTIDFTDSSGKSYALNNKTAVLFLRPRGLHLAEKHFNIHGKAASASFVDFGLYFFHNAHELIRQGRGPFFYLPKIESHLEAKLWNDVFDFAQSYLGLPSGTIKATVLVETLPAAFQLNEILSELRNHSAGMNCGRWDYIFSYIKTLKAHKRFVVPNRDQITMTVPFMAAYSDLVIHTCHKRGAHAIGGMAAQIPIKSDSQANASAIEKVRLDKLREVTSGHDGSWVAHPGLVSVAMTVFESNMTGPNQIHEKRLDARIAKEDLLKVPTGTVTEEGLRKNINVGLLYLESWLRGTGAAAIYHVMEDAATAEISRSQLWQWIAHETYLPDGRLVTEKLYQRCKLEELLKIRELLGDSRYNEGQFDHAVDLFDQLVLSETLTDFLTLPGYDYLS
ncbi:MAG: malate synthase [Paraglaciecola sp.]|jgi:malate synthase